MMKSIRFTNLYEEVYAFIHEKTKTIYMPQNFIPNPKISYPIDVLTLQETWYGSYIHNGVKYDLVRVHHKDYNSEGVPYEKTASMMEIIDYEFGPETKGKNPALGVFDKLNSLKKDLPKMPEPLRFSISPEKKKEYNIGDIIVRPVKVMDDGSFSDEWKGEFKETEKGDWVFYADPYISYLPLACASSIKSKSRIVCFSNTHPGDDWVAFKVVGKNKASTCLFVKPIKGAINELVTTIQEMA